MPSPARPLSGVATLSERLAATSSAPSTSPIMPTLGSEPAPGGMSQSPHEALLPAKPGTACLACRSRKLKCSRGADGCVNCIKSDLPCVYPTPETGVKRKRGPYKKDKPARERHLEDLCRYLEPKGEIGGGYPNGSTSSPGPEAYSKAGTRDQQTSTSPVGSAGGRFGPSLISRIHGGDPRQPAKSEALVKDALVALTQSAVLEREAHGDKSSRPAASAVGESRPLPVLYGVHPPPRVIFEYWHLFVSRVDPLLKLVHAPTLLGKIFTVIDDIQNASPSLQTLLFGVYYSAICACTAQEVRERFGESRDTLLHRYGRTIELSMSDDYNAPALESLQGLLLYLKCVQRSQYETNVRALFSLGVKLARLIGLQKDPEGVYSPFEAEMRRRAWWHLCGLEVRGAEEGESRAATIMENQDVRFPANLHDYDLREGLAEPPPPRIGVTDMLYALVRLEIMYLSFQLWRARRELRHLQPHHIQAEQRRIMKELEERLEERYLRHMHRSRVFDWMCSEFMDALTTKHRMMIDYPLSQMPAADMSPGDRLEVLQASVKIIRLNHCAAHDERMGPFRWFYRNWMQWPSLAIVIVELASSTNPVFARDAWAVLDPVLAGWDRMYASKKDEPSWAHVNSIIERARQMRTRTMGPPASRTLDLAMLPPAANGPTPHDATNPAATPSGDWTAPVSRVALTNLVSAADNAMMGPLANMESWDRGLGDIDFTAFDAVFGDAAWASPDIANFPLGNMSFVT